MATVYLYYCARKWVNEVSYDPQTVYTNVITIPSSSKHVNSSYTVIGGNMFKCEDNQTIAYSSETFDPTDITFAIVRNEGKG
jgi:hypothetical protein